MQVRPCWPTPGTRTVIAALIKQAKKLLEELYKSLTWDQTTSFDHLIGRAKRALQSFEICNSYRSPIQVPARVGLGLAGCRAITA